MHKTQRNRNTYGRNYFLCFYLFAFTIFSTSLLGQNILIDQFPKDLQFFPRDTTSNLATISIAGNIPVTGPQVVQIKVFRQDSLYFNGTKNLIGITKEPFLFSVNIKAEFANYNFELYLDSTLVDSAQNVVAGDVFLIQGQSNAAASLYGGSYQNIENPWLRSFGTSTTDPNQTFVDTSWYLANAVSNNAGWVGIWGKEMGDSLSNSLQLPICILNGAVGGTSILQHLADSSTTNIYGRLRYRVQQAGLRDHIRAVFWWQGEKDAAGNHVSSSAEYYNAFLNLRASWYNDFPSIEHIFFTQIHTVNNFILGNEIREAQRQLTQDLPDLCLQTVFTLDNFDGGAHHGAAGYKQFSNRILPQIKRNLYRKADSLNIDPPSILSAHYADPLQQSIDLIFDQTINFDSKKFVAGLDTVYLKDYFFLDGVWGKVDSLSVNEDTLRLHLSAAVAATTITYLPAAFYHNSWIVYDGPWLTNDLGIGVASFHELNIAPYPAPLQLRVFLEGSFQEDSLLMTTKLSAAPMLLSAQPYYVAPWFYQGTEGNNFSSYSIHKETVDWVLVSLRTSLESNTELWQAAALLDADGYLRFPALDWPFVDGEAFYVLIEHRNHIGALSSEPIVIENGVLSYDFTTQDAHNGAGLWLGQKEMLSNIWGLIAGDGDQVNDPSGYDINGQDLGLFYLSNGSFNAYLPADFNLDGDVNGQDRIVWEKNNGAFSAIQK